MQAIIDMDDLRLIRIAARRWAVDNPDNPNADRVKRAVDNTHATSEWILTPEDKK